MQPISHRQKPFSTYYLSKEDSQPNPRPFLWKEFMSERGCIPAKSPVLFPHVQFLEKTLAERLYPHGMVVNCKSVDGNIKRVKIEVVCEQMVLVEFLDGESKMEWVHVEKLGLPEFTCDGLEWMWEQSDVAKLFGGEKSKIFNRIGDFIQPGQVFELQDKTNPVIVNVVKIVENYNGLVKVETFEGENFHTHITSELCHRLGWSANNFEYVEPCKENEYTNGKFEPIPAWVFESNVLKEHKFEVGMLLEVLDPKTRMIFYPGFVSKVFNKYHFAVKIVENILMDKNQMEEIICNRSSADIYPAYWCQKQSLRFTAPKGMLESDFSFTILRQKLCLRHTCAPDSYFDITKVVKKVEKMRYLEFWDETVQKLVPATIIRSYKHFVFVHTENLSKCTSPKIYSCRSINLFPCHFGQKSEFPYIQMDKLPSFSVRRFDLTNTFTSHKTPIFYEGKKKFLSQVWLRGDLWLPAIYVNTKCFSGPFINPDRVKTLNGRYGPGPLPLIMKQILSDLLGCAYKTRELADIIAADKSSKMPKIQVKCRKNYRRVRVSVECCEQLSEFGGWLRSILTQVDACPNLLSFDKRDNCPGSCYMMASNPYMTQLGHINMAYLSTIPAKQLPKRLPNLSISGSVKAKRGGRIPEVPTKFRIVQPPKQTEPVFIDDEVSRDSAITTTSTASDSSDSSDESEVEEKWNNSNAWQTFKAIEEYGSEMSLLEKHLQDRVQPKSLYTNYENSTPVSKIKAGIRPMRGSMPGPIRVPTTNGGIVVTRANGGIGPRIRAPAVSLYSFTNGNRFIEKASQPPYEPLRMPTAMRRVHSSEQLQTSTSKFFDQQLPRGDLSLVRHTSNGNHTLDTKSNELVTPPNDLAKKRSPLQTTPSVSPTYPPITSNPSKWSATELAEWIRKTDSIGIANKLLDEDVDGEALMLLSFDDCRKHLDLKLGPAIKLSALIEELKKNVAKF